MFHLINEDRMRRFDLPMPTEIERKKALKDKIIQILAVADNEDKILSTLHGSKILRESYLKNNEIPKTKSNYSNLNILIKSVQGENSWKPSNLIIILQRLEIDKYGFEGILNFNYFLAYLDEILFFCNSNKATFYKEMVEVFNDGMFQLNYYWNEEVGIIEKKLGEKVENLVTESKKILNHNKNVQKLYELGLEGYLKGYKGSDNFVWFESLLKLKEVYDMLLKTIFDDKTRISPVSGVTKAVYGNATNAPSNFERDLSFIVKNIHHTQGAERYSFKDFSDYEQKWKFMIQIILDLLKYQESQKSDK